MVWGETWSSFQLLDPAPTFWTWKKFIESVDRSIRNPCSLVALYAHLINIDAAWAVNPAGELSIGVGEGGGVDVGDGETVGVGTGVPVGVGEGGDGVAVGVLVGDAVGDGVGKGDTLGVGVGVAGVGVGDVAVADVISTSLLGSLSCTPSQATATTNIGLPLKTTCPVKLGPQSI